MCGRCKTTGVSDRESVRVGGEDGSEHDTPRVNLLFAGGETAAQSLLPLLSLARHKYVSLATLPRPTPTHLVCLNGSTRQLKHCGAVAPLICQPS